VRGLRLFLRTTGFRKCDSRIGGAPTDQSGRTKELLLLFVADEEVAVARKAA